VAVENEWGGPESADKRDSLAGEVAEMLISRSDLDEEDMQDVLLQALEDLFNVDLEDGSEAAIAALILRIRRETMLGDFTTVDRMWELYSSKVAKTKPVKVDAQSESGDSVDDESDEDIDMEDAAPLKDTKARAEPEIDEDGFTTVVRRKR
jgi:pre-rRNA-processing protein TSR2